MSNLVVIVIVLIELEPLNSFIFGVERFGFGYGERLDVLTCIVTREIVALFHCVDVRARHKLVAHNSVQDDVAGLVG